MLRPPIRRFLPLLLALALCTASPASGVIAPQRLALGTNVLLGDAEMESQQSLLAAGRPRTFRLRANASGLAAKVRLYVDTQSTAAAILVGLYRNENDGPGPLLSRGSISHPREGSWNVVSFAPDRLVSGRSYWLTVLARGGTLHYRSRLGGRCLSETSYERNLRALPSSWKKGGLRSHTRCPISAYALAAIVSAPQRNMTSVGTIFTPGPASSLGPSPVGPFPEGPPAPVEQPPTRTPPAAPSNAAPPAISGISVEGQTLTSTAGSWSGSQTEYEYQWQDCDTLGASCTNISGATGTTYKLAASDVGHTVRVVVSARNEGGAGAASSQVSAVVAAIPPPPLAPMNIALPVISGTVAVEGALTASPGTWTGSATDYAYQWQDCNSSGASCTSIDRATGPGHKLAAGEVGHTVRVVVTASNEGGSTSASAVQTSVVPGASGGPFISPSGSDSNPCTQAQPCLTMDHAYREAEAGQTVQMLAGSYPGQAISNDQRKSSSSDVVFTPAEGANVQVTNTIYVFASHLTIESITVQDVTIGNYDQTAARPDPSDIMLRDLTGRNFEIDSARNVIVEGGSWGPADACGGPSGGNNNSIRQPTAAPANILVDNTTIHDVQSYDLVKCHIEGLAIFAGTGVTVSNSKFYGNSVYDIFMQANSGGHPNNITLTNNWMAAAVDNSGANGHPAGWGNGVAVGDSGINENLTMQGNHFNGVLQMDDNGTNGVYENVKVEDNVGMMPYENYPCGSLVGIQWTKNIWQNDSCGSSDLNLRGAAMPYQNATNDSALDYTLTGSYANW